MRLLSELICLMKFCYHITAFERVLRADCTALHIIVVVVVVVSRMMISMSNTCPWGPQLLHSLLGFCHLCPGKCSIRLERNNKPRLTSFIPHHLSKDAIIFISAPYEACLSGSSQSLLSPGWACFISPFIKVTASFPCVYFLSRGNAAARLPAENPQGIKQKVRMLVDGILSAENKIWLQIYHTCSLHLNCNLNIYRGTRF